MTDLKRKDHDSELILNEDGSIYHLNLFPNDISDTIFLVGDPERVPMVSDFFDTIEIKKQKREFVTHTGTLRNKKLTVISTGIGTDNIDIVMNELDALANINLQTGQVNQNLKSLSIIRIGTSGSMHPEIDTDEIVVSTHGLGLDILMHFYGIDYTQEEIKHAESVSKQIHLKELHPYLIAGNEELISLFSDQHKGITATCAGFYAPQGRKLRAPHAHPEFLQLIMHADMSPYRITNFEMETAAIYGMSRMLGHKAVSVNAIMANRVLQKFSSTPHESVKKTIELVVSRIA